MGVNMTFSTTILALFLAAVLTLHDVRAASTVGCPCDGVPTASGTFVGTIASCWSSSKVNQNGACVDACDTASTYGYFSTINATGSCGKRVWCQVKRCLYYNTNDCSICDVCLPQDEQGTGGNLGVCYPNGVWPRLAFSFVTVAPTLIRPIAWQCRRPSPVRPSTPRPARRT